MITTAPSIRSGIGDYARHLLPYLREHCDVDVFVGPHERQASGSGGRDSRSVAELVPREYDQILYQLGNERAHAFMARMVRTLGGTVMQHDWVLFDMAMHAFPGLTRGGVKGHALALREGGLEQLRLYSRNWLDRRRQRTTPYRPQLTEPIAGTILAGWHDAEPSGRWTSDRALFRLPAEGVEGIEIELDAEPSRRVRILDQARGGHALAEGGGGSFEVEPLGRDRPLIAIDTEGLCVTPEQRMNGDSRRLGCFVRSIRWSDPQGMHELDLSEPAVAPITSVTLSRDRFRLPLNRSIVRFADAFIVHSEYLRQRILRERNALTSIGIVHHGSERRWRDEDRYETRRRLGLDPRWVDSFLVTSFGGVQPHKRIDVALRGLALAREERPDLRVVLAGSISSGEFDPRGTARRLGIEDAVHFTGFVPEATGWDWLHAGDISLNLRGPSSGGTSGGIFQAFSMGRSVIASDAYEQEELPGSCVVKIPLGEGEAQAIARALVELRDDRSRRAQLEAAARRFVDEECHWSIVARRYAELLGSFPAARAARRSLVRQARG